MTQSSQRRLDQNRHEDYWAKCWAAPLGKYLNAQNVRTSRPNDVATPPDVTFHVRRSDGNETTTWGEITDVSRKAAVTDSLSAKKIHNHLF